MAPLKGIALRRLRDTTKLKIIGQVKKDMSTEDTSERRAVDIVCTR